MGGSPGATTVGPPCHSLTCDTSHFDRLDANFRARWNMATVVLTCDMSQSARLLANTRACEVTRTRSVDVQFLGELACKSISFPPLHVHTSQRGPSARVVKRAKNQENTPTRLSFHCSS